MLTCTKCRQEKGEIFFSNCTRRKTGKTAWCKACVNENSKARYVANIEKERQRSRDRTKSFPEKRAETRKRWADKNPEYWENYYQENRERMLELGKANAKNNASAYNVRMSAYRAAKVSATPSWANFDDMRMWYEVAEVLSRSGVKFEVDHIVPIKGELVCGLHTHDNMQILTKAENVRKLNRFVVE